VRGGPGRAGAGDARRADFGRRLRALENSGRRPLPAGLGAPGEYPEAPLAAARPEVPWLQPIPDALVSTGSAVPAEIVASRQSMRLPLIAALQYLPARRRAVLILRDVLRWRAAEVADLLPPEEAGGSPEGPRTLRPSRGNIRALAEQLVP
jgi:DNA-directed RNA polymerase specialized sigma24 family protein